MHTYGFIVSYLILAVLGSKSTAEDRRTSCGVGELDNSYQSMRGHVTAPASDWASYGTVCSDHLLSILALTRGS